MGNLQVVEEEQNIHGRKILASQPRNVGAQGASSLSCLPCLIQIRLRQTSKTSFLKQVILYECLGHERREGQIFFSCFLINSIKSTSQMSTFRVAKLWFPSLEYKKHDKEKGNIVRKIQNNDISFNMLS